MDSHPAPGIHQDRLDSAEIPEDAWVDFQGPGRNRATALELLSLEVNGELRAKSAKSPITIETDSTITVGPTGVVGGVSPGAGGKEKKVAVSLESKKDSISIAGRVESEGDSLSLKAKGNVSVSGIANSWESWASLESDTGSVKISNGGIVAACGNVGINSGPGKPTDIKCRVHSRVGSVIINGKRQKNPGNVTIGKKDSVTAYREVVIYADTLRVEGTILANTIHKYCRVTLLDSTGHIKGKLKTKNKIDTLQTTKEKSDGRPAERGNDCRITGTGASVIDLSASPGAIVADSYTKIAVGPGGTIDLRGNYPGWQVISCPGPIELFADNVLLELGVPIETICGPGPVLVNPSFPAKDVATVLGTGKNGYPDRSVDVEARITNMGNVSDDYSITVTDTEGWPFSVSASTVSLGYLSPCDSVVTITFDVPPWAVPGLDTNRVFVDVVSITDPSVAYSETTYVAVRDSNLLREFSLSHWETASGGPGDTASVYHWIMNIGALHDEYMVTVDDSLGWVLLPDTSVFDLATTYDSIYNTGMVIPEGANDGDINKLYIKVTSTVDTGTTQSDTVQVEVGTPSAVGDDVPVIRTIRHQSFPNPFNPHVTIRFTVPPSNEQTVVEVFDVKGRHVATVFAGRLSTGEHSKTWDGTDKTGSPAASGVYLYRIRVGELWVTGKLTLVR